VSPFKRFSGVYALYIPRRSGGVVQRTCDCPCDRDSATCGWCLGDHPTHACPRGPRLSVAAVLAFAAEAMGRGGRVWA
jgi:hypothetical protein